MKKYTERIRDLREDHDLKQSDIAKLLQTTQQVYSRYEQGINEMPVRHLVVLARFYGVSLDYIMGETDIKERYPESIWRGLFPSPRRPFCQKNQASAPLPAFPTFIPVLLEKNFQSLHILPQSDKH